MLSFGLVAATLHHRVSGVFNGNATLTTLGSTLIKKKPECLIFLAKELPYSYFSFGSKVSGVEMEPR